MAPIVCNMRRGYVLILESDIPKLRVGAELHIVEEPLVGKGYGILLHGGDSGCSSGKIDCSLLLKTPRHYISIYMDIRIVGNTGTVSTYKMFKRPVCVIDALNNSA